MKNIHLFIHSNSIDELSLVKRQLLSEIALFPYLEAIYNTERDFFNNKNTFGKFQPFTTIKLIKELNTCVHIYYIPKIFNMHTCAIIETNETKTDINNIKNKFKNFYNKCNSLYNHKNYLICGLTNNSENLNLTELDFDLQILLNVKNLLKNLNKKDIEEIIYSEFLEGAIDYELNNFNHNKNILIQKKHVRNDDLFNTINSFIKIKCDQLYMGFLKEHKNNFSICSKIFYLIQEIKKITGYNNNQYFYSKSELLKLLKNKKFLHFYTDNKKLFLNLEKLILNDIGLDKDLFKRQTLQMDKVWERYVEEYFKEQKILFVIQNEQKFQKIVINNEVIFKKLRPDLLSDFIGDAKYKIIHSDYLKSDYYSEDYNKILRDCIYHKKTNGILIFPKKEGVSNIITTENLDGLSGYNIEIKEIEFIYE